MRIIAGEFRHRKLISPPETAPTRPIPDRVKEALFNLLRGWTEDAVVLDVFAGSGAIGLEAVSRGASRCVFVEKDRRVADLLQRNIDALGCGDRCEIIRADALGPALLTRVPRDVDLMFFDPPYALVDEAEGWERVRVQFGRAMGLLKPKAFAVLRTPWPFKHFVPDEVVAEAGSEEEAQRMERRKGGKGAKEARRRRGEDDERVWEGEDLRELEATGYAEAMEDEDDDVDGFDDEMEGEGEDGEGEEGDGAGESAPRGPAGRWVPADLSIIGATGPETHIYGSSEVHFYAPMVRAEG
jgi:16S rRNA (guanine(966)-N(2))-methyltransferase RsmD